MDDVEEEDVYRLTMDEEEGSRDSEDNSFRVHSAPSTGVTNDLASMELSSQSRPSVPTSSRSQHKRKRVDQATKKKKLKMPAMRQIIDAISIITNAIKDKAPTTNDIREWSVGTVIKDLLAVEEVQAAFAFPI